MAARVAAIAEPVLAGIGYRLVRVRDFRARRLHRPDHGRAAGRDDDDRGLRNRLARALAGARRRRPDRARLSARSVLARASTARWCGARISSVMPATSVKVEMAVAIDGPAAVPRLAARRRRRRPPVFAATMPRRRDRPRWCCRSTRWRKPSSCSPTTLIAESLRRGKAAAARSATGRSDSAQQRAKRRSDDIQPHRPMPTRGHNEGE